MRTLTTTGLAAAAILTTATCWGQSFNVDVDAQFGPRSLGIGAPSPLFAGAAGRPGYWNVIYGANGGPFQLRGLDGRLTPVMYRAWGGIGTGGGWRNPRIDLGEANDDFWLLMGDAGNVGSPEANHQLFPPPPLRVTRFEGLEPGLYEVYTYAVLPAPPPRYVPVEVTVPGALTENPQLCTGPMPADWVFRRGVTHAMHRVFCADGVIEIRLTGPWPNAVVNGFQLKKLQ
ncbi:MAG: hypothetical protein AB1725_03445 [Armatimonadota bacterium]